MKKDGSDMRIVCSNRKARYNYFIDDEMEAGMVLQGTEVKALRLGRANLRDAHAKIRNGEIFLYEMHIGPYPYSTHDPHPPLRVRKLLMHKGEIKRLIGKIQTKGYTLIPLSVYFSNGRAKVSLGLARGKRKYDKREAIKKRDQKRDMERSRSED